MPLPSAHSPPQRFWVHGGPATPQPRVRKQQSLEDEFMQKLKAAEARDAGGAKSQAVFGKLFSSFDEDAAAEEAEAQAEDAVEQEPGRHAQY